MSRENIQDDPKPCEAEEVQRVLAGWNREEDRAKLDEIAAQLAEIPEEVFGKSTASVTVPLSQFLTVMNRRHGRLIRLQELCAEQGGGYYQTKSQARDCSCYESVDNFFGTSLQEACEQGLIPACQEVSCPDTVTCTADGEICIEEWAMRLFAVALSTETGGAHQWESMGVVFLNRLAESGVWCSSVDDPSERLVCLLASGGGVSGFGADVLGGDYSVYSGQTGCDFFNGWLIYQQSRVDGTALKADGTCCLPPDPTWENRTQNILSVLRGTVAGYGSSSTIFGEDRYYYYRHLRTEAEFEWGVRQVCIQRAFETLYKAEVIEGIDQDLAYGFIAEGSELRRSYDLRNGDIDVQIYGSEYPYLFVSNVTLQVNDPGDPHLERILTQEVNGRSLLPDFELPHNFGSLQECMDDARQTVPFN